MIELMVAVCFLALGTLLVQECFIRSAALYGRYSSSLRARLYASEKLWEAREGAVYAKEPQLGSDAGAFDAAGRRYDWTVDSSQEGKDLYAIRLAVRWTDGNRPVSLEREAYAAKPKTALGE